MANKTVTFTITQTLPNPNDIKGWQLYRSEDGGSNYVMVVSENEWVYPGAPQAEYTYDYIESIAAGQTLNLKYYIRAIDTDGFASPNSNVLDVVIEAVPPNAPVAVSAIVS